MRSSKKALFEQVKENLGKNLNLIKIEDQEEGYGNLLDSVKVSKKITFKVDEINSCSRSMVGRSSVVSPQNKLNEKNETVKFDGNISVGFNFEEKNGPYMTEQEIFEEMKRKGKSILK